MSDRKILKFLHYDFIPGLSQVAAEIHSSQFGGKKSTQAQVHEALCIELLGVLKRGFTQQVGVRMSLYRGLYDVVVKNPELCLKVLQLLYQHALKHELDNMDMACPIDIDEIVIEEKNGSQVTVVVSHFLFIS